MRAVGELRVDPGVAHQVHKGRVGERRDPGAESGGRGGREGGAGEVGVVGEGDVSGCKSLQIGRGGDMKGLFGGRDLSAVEHGDKAVTVEVTPVISRFFGAAGLAAPYGFGEFGVPRHARVAGAGELCQAGPVRGPWH